MKVCRPIQASACGFPPRMDVDGTRTLCSLCGLREVYNIGQETPQCPFFGNCTPYKTVFVQSYVDSGSASMGSLGSDINNPSIRTAGPHRINASLFNIFHRPSRVDCGPVREWCQHWAQVVSVKALWSNLCTCSRSASPDGRTEGGDFIF